MSRILAEKPARSAALLKAARGGDERAFRELVDPCRQELELHCYRMLASAPDAEDALQEALLGAWLGLSRFEGRSSLRSWLYRVATNTCLDAMRKRPSQILPSDTRSREDVGNPDGELRWVGPFPFELAGLEDELAGPEARYEQRESVELAFVAALQHLSGKQRAVLILRDVLGFTAHEAAGVLGMTSTAVNSALQHARRRIHERLPSRSQQLTLHSLGEERLEEVVRRYCEALEQGDGSAMAGLLTEDAVWAMPPTSRQYKGHAAIIAFLKAEPFTISWRHVVARANGQLAVGWYRRDEGRCTYIAEVFEVLTLRGAQISAVTAFIDRELFARFGLPDHLPVDERS